MHALRTALLRPCLVLASAQRRSRLDRSLVGVLAHAPSSYPFIQYTFHCVANFIASIACACGLVRLALASWQRRNLEWMQ